MAENNESEKPKKPETGYLGGMVGEAARKLREGPMRNLNRPNSESEGNGSGTSNSESEK